MSTTADHDAAQMDVQTKAVLKRIGIYFGELNPTGSISFDYVTEGAANVVWRVCFHDSNLGRHDSNVVLRMRKDIPSTIPMTELRQQFEDRIAPMFLFDPSLLLPIHLIQLSSNLIEQLNVQLRRLEDEGFRNQSRTGTYHPNSAIEEYAMIMPNLGHGIGKVIEFKPKWLHQSPSAPRNARRCRTCALNTMRRMKGGTGRGDSGFCPFDLLSSDDMILGNALRQIWCDSVTLPEFVNAFSVRVQPALRQLQELQRQHGSVGLEDFCDPDRNDFSVAMALRDCSVVLKVTVSEHQPQLGIPTVKLLDLDLKDTGGGKLAKWSSIEAELINQGWYTTMPSDLQCAMTFQ